MSVVIRQDSPKIAVLLAAYNGMPWIEEQVASILVQQYVQVTLFVSVDPSQDDTFAWLQSQAAQDSRIVLLESQASGGAGQNFFRLISEIDPTAYDAFSFSDQDDVWLENKLISAWQSIQHYRVAAYSGNIISFWPNGKRKLIVKSQPQTQHDYLFESAGPGCTFLLTQPLFSALQAFVKAQRCALKQVFFHDWFVYAFARSHGYRWFIDPTPYLLYRQHPNNVHGANVGLSQISKRIKALLNGQWYQQVYSISQLLAHQDPAAAQLAAGLRQRRQGLWLIVKNVRHYRRRQRDRYLLASMSGVLLLKGLTLAKRYQPDNQPDTGGS